MRPMSNVSPYWIWVRVNAFGTGQRVEDEIAHDFFQDRFSALLSQTPFPHPQIQQQLHQWNRDSDPSVSPAERCLRCFISNQIKQVCVDLEQRFGATHDFTHRELLPFVLSESPSPVFHRSNPCLVDRILETFDPSKSTLSAWSARLFKSDRLVKRFLLDRGIEQVTDWLILNRTSLGKLTAVLQQQQATQQEIQEATELLEQYHQVYRKDLLQQRSEGTKRRFPEPTDAQLEEIAAALKLSPQQVLKQLKYLAGVMRVARIQARGGILPPSVQLPTLELTPPVDPPEQSEFLDRYYQEFQEALQGAIAQVINTRLQSYDTGKTEKQKLKAKEKQALFLNGLYLFHCQGISMGEIAQQLELGDQPRVSRLLQLKRLRADIGRWTLQLLGDRVLNLAQAYVDPEHLSQVAAKIHAILDEEVQSTLDEAIREASCNQRPTVPSQLTESICHYVKTQLE